MNFKYQCTSCAREFKQDEITYTCPECSSNYKIGEEPVPGVLKAVFDYDSIKQKWDAKSPDWNLFSCVPKEFYPPFPAGNTPLVFTPTFAKKCGFENVYVKNDGLNPSGSLKDRASFLVVAEANRIGENCIVAASTGNAASALAAVCASAGRQAIIFVPKSAPKAKLVQMILYGANVVLVDGTYDDAFKLSIEYTNKKGGLNRNTAYHPLTIEGKKTVAFEIFEQLNMEVPDAVLVPVGDGVIISGVYKGFKDLLLAGITDRMPKLIACQAEKSNSIASFFETGKYANAPDPSTVADSISVAAPANAVMAVQAMKETDGFPVLVSDQDILDGQALLASTSGIFAEPAASASAAGLLKCKELLKKDSKIVVLATGNGLKDINAAMKGVSLPEPIPPELSLVPDF